MLADRFGSWLRTVLDWRLLAALVVCTALVFPYLIAGSDTVPSGSNANLKWVGENIVPRYFEFILIEFVGFAIVLVGLRWRDPLLWAAIAFLLVLPLYRFGPNNDLVMRASIPGLTLLAIELGRWLSTPGEVRRHRRKAAVAILLLASARSRRSWSSRGSSSNRHGRWMRMRRWSTSRGVPIT